MSLLLNKEPRFQSLAPKVVGMLLLTAAALFTILTALGFTRGLFVRSEIIHVHLPDGRGIHDGTAVMLKGFRVGSVVGLKLTDEGTVDARVSVESHYLSRFSRSSTVKRGRDNLLGDLYLEIEPSPHGEPLMSGDTLQLVGGGELDDVMAQAQARLFPLLEHVDALVTDLSDPKGSWQLTMNGIQSTMQRMDRSLDAVDKSLMQMQALAGAGQNLLSRELPPLLAQSRALMAETRQTNAQIAASVSEVQQSLPEIRLKIGRSLDDLHGLMPGVAQSTESGTRLLDDAQQSLQDFRDSWPAQALMPTATPALLPQDSHD